MAFAPGYVRAEALDLLAMCAQVGGPTPIPSPSGWAILFDSPVLGVFYEKWQLWESSGGDYAIVLRGSVMQPGSILEDLISVLVPAKTSITVGAVSIPFQFAADPAAAVHLGFALGTLILLKSRVSGILAQLAQWGIGAGSNVYITGHSQGAAMATLLRSYLEYAQVPNGDAPAGVSYKTYVYAQPKPGNDHYATDFESKFSNPGLGFRVTNSLDWVPQVPFTIELVRDLNAPNPLTVLGLPSPLIAGLKLAVEGPATTARRLIVNHARKRLKPAAAALAQCVAPPGSPAPKSAFKVTILPSLNFVNAGTDEALIGDPCVGVECQDPLFEHHPETYYALL
jgi:hypothetical protein